MKKGYYRASVTVETTYISVFIFFSIIFIVYFTLSVYNASVLTSKAYYVLEKHISEEKNEEVQGLLMEDVSETIKRAGTLGTAIETSIETEFDKISIDYVFDAPMFDKNKGLSEVGNIHEIHTSSKRERICESLFFLKQIKDGVNELLEND